VQLKAVFPNAERQLWPGTFVNAELTVRVVKDGLTIPTDAVQQGAQGEFVFVIGKDNKVAPRQVQVMQRNRGVALVSKGLQPNETVVTQGQYRLTDGAEVVSARADQVANTSAGSSGLLP
jgi:multidrug efflux system membrane fusion protein